MTATPSDDRKYRHQRERLVETLRERGIHDERVLSAVGAVARHAFVDPALRDRAYADEALPIGLNQTISQPFTVAYQTALLGVRPDDRILEVGTGSGFQAAVLCEMGARVYSIERHDDLLRRARSVLDGLGYDVRTRHGDGTRGWPAFAPYDGIVVTAGAPEMPAPLLHQLREPSGEDDGPGGRLVIPIGGREGQTMTRVRRTGSGPHDYEQEEFHSFRFVPLVDEDEGGG
ncbi:protein-L-isoaspartate(D-aspartate) O-methyltransferase [Salinibacter ruber]|jgi:protein-L-isoaspartate(D-aspartate) O-methyltransferase|uniref:protein-L-isoaspartate(D-aspartate) O-methyltransferase n=1 Tax=Salinibacter ruber TaxID=146919 RepID=UPI00216A0FCD|nr:protein-L-isoaspartate(D-aspartate) O-methyltransferase [Salinibacter ruber]MCS3632895.1 protein-L-isoaspartate(D-aspartate) O-methyltransferase [Salinibacter ruber]MCS3648909.1 protein-L-isoaspartate(D-aspartate) O-methyltransferase [Salinibacter ruber]MCS3652163.1 protein-L-isoaspartate(D-aspartate) O-methyltransferase [Salinibacter ruber]MCS3713330.1 protein-L-isoaspartate(D-aspartate) O-methyltransferase [Salinibacter ruber]